MPTLAEAMAKAKSASSSASDGNASASKRAKTDSAIVATADQASLHPGMVDLLRDHLKMKGVVQKMANANFLTVLYHCDQLKDGKREVLSHWHKQWSAHKEAKKESVERSAQLPECPVPYRKLYALGYFLDTINTRIKTVTDSEYSGKQLPTADRTAMTQVQTAINAINDQDPELLGLVLSDFSSEFSTPMKDRPWKWDLIQPLRAFRRAAALPR